MLVMRLIVAQSAVFQPNQELPIQPFRLCAESKSAPTEFEVTFFHDKVRYQFGFSSTSQRIMSEWLIAYRSQRPQTWYSRVYDPDSGSYDYKLGSNLQGAKVLWKEATRPNSLFLSTAIQLNSEQLKPIFDWITENWIVNENKGIPEASKTIAHIAERGPDSIKQFLSTADISIENIELRPVQGVMRSFVLDVATGKMNNSIEKRDMLVPTFLHRSALGSAEFDITEESDGTQRLFALAGPLLSIFERGNVLIIDELDKSLHALLVRHLIELFQDPVINKNNAQLVFTTHDTSLLEGKLLRRDQIWFTDKDENQVSKLFPLTDFAPRKDEALERGYLGGRYGAIPFLRSWSI
jgi:hypothetical protein